MFFTTGTVLAHHFTRVMSMRGTSTVRTYSVVEDILNLASCWLASLATYIGN